MDLKSTYPYWPIKEGLLATYPPLAQSIDCEVVVLGAGITGALVADQLTRLGMEVVVLDRRDVGQGSTSATTGLLQYEIDVPLCELIQKVGQADAERAYLLCLESISVLAQLAKESSIPCGFERKTSLYAASHQRDVPLLRNEYAVRKDCGINVELVEGGAVRDGYHLDAPALLVSPEAAVCNAFAFTHGLLQNCLKRGAKVFDRTEATQFVAKSDHVEIMTDRQHQIRAQHLVFANGYESQHDLRKKIVKLKSTYALVTQPLDDISPWNSDWIYWESSRPYLYLRTTEDQRLLVGGEDDSFRSPLRRDASVERKSLRLLERLQQMFPHLPVEAEYSWAGTFGETKDGLAYIGPSPQLKHAYYALGFGGNGITFSAIAARILADLITGKPNPDAEIFRFGR